MKLRKLTLTNYRIHANSTLDLGDASLVFLRGRNMSGKTSFAEGLSMALANTTVSLPSDGKGYTAKISQGESKAVITAEIQGQHLIRHIITMATNTTGRTPETECLDCADEKEGKEVVHRFKNFLADRKNALLIALNSEYFSRLDEKAQTDLLAKLVLPARYDFPKDKIEATNGFLDTAIDFEANPFDVITKAYKALYKERETVNRQVKDFVIPDALPKAKDVDSESLNTQLKAIREQRFNLQKDRDDAVAKANEIEVKRGRLQTKIEGLRAEVDKGKKRLVELDATVLDAEALEALGATAKKKAELDNLKEQHGVVLGAIRTLNQQIGRLKDISEQGATCPVCDQDIDANKIATLITDLEKESDDNDAVIQKLDTQIEAIGDVHAAQESLKKHEAAVKEKSALETSLMETVKTGKATKAELEALPEAVNATLPFNNPLADLQAKEDKLNEQLRPVLQAEERAKERERLTEQLKKLQAKAAKLDSLTKYFDKDGVKAELIGKYIGGFESKLKEVMSAWGYEASLSDDMRFEVKTKRDYSGPIKEISGAEEFIFNAAFQCAVSIAAGINLVVIDEVERLGEDIRKFLVEKLHALLQNSVLEQAILIGFSLNKTLPMEPLLGSKYFFVSDGTVEELR